MMEDFWIWKSNICRYEGINLNVINGFLDISAKDSEVPVTVGLSFVAGRLGMNLTLFNMSLES
jgi:hypothetical protein